MKKYIFWLGVVLLCLQTTPAFSQSKWVHQHLAPFSFRFPKRWKRAVQPILYHAREDLRKLEKIYAIQYTKTIYVRFSEPGSAFAHIQPHGWNPSHDIAGLAYPKRSLITMRIRNIEGAAVLRQTFQHELSHLFIAYAAHYKKVPLWFNEGVAMLLSNDFGDMERMALLSAARVSGKWPALRTLQHHFPYTPNARKLAYAVSLDAVVFLNKRIPNMIPNVLKRIRAGARFEDAISNITGTSWKELQKTWKDQTQSKYGWLTLLTQEGLVWSLALFLFLGSYIRIRKQRQKQFEALEDEEETWIEHTSSIQSA